MWRDPLIPPGASLTDTPVFRPPHGFTPDWERLRSRAPPLLDFVNFVFHCPFFFFLFWDGNWDLESAHVVLCWKKQMMRFSTPFLTSCLTRSALCRLKPTSFKNRQGTYPLRTFLKRAGARLVGITSIFLNGCDQLRWDRVAAGTRCGRAWWNFG